MIYVILIAFHLIVHNEPDNLSIIKSMHLPPNPHWSTQEKFENETCVHEC